MFHMYIHTTVIMLKSRIADNDRNPWPLCVWNVSLFDGIFSKDAYTTQRMLLLQVFCIMLITS